MPNTQNRAYPYPSLAATPNVPADMQALAQKVDDDVTETTKAIHMYLRNGGNQGIADGVTDNIAMTTTLEKVGGMDSDGIDFIVPTAGVYAVAYNLCLAGGSPGGMLRFRGFWLKNGQTPQYAVAAGVASIEPLPGYGGTTTLARTFLLAAGDRVRMKFQPLGTAVTLPDAIGVAATITCTGRV